MQFNLNSACSITAHYENKQFVCYLNVHLSLTCRYILHSIVQVPKPCQCYSSWVIQGSYAIIPCADNCFSPIHNMCRSTWPTTDIFFHDAHRSKNYYNRTSNYYLHRLRCVLLQYPSRLSIIFRIFYFYNIPSSSILK